MSSTESSLNHSRTALIDSSLKASVLLFVIAGVKWLFWASIFGYIAAWKSHNPEFLNGYSFLTFGRVQAAYSAILVYGFACNLAFAGGLWLTARLSGSEVQHGLVVSIAAFFWNIALAVGIVGILIGDLGVHEYRELPGYVAVPLLLSSLVVSVWVIVTFKTRTHSEVYASEWFLLAAFLVFPWIQMVAYIMLVVNPPFGVVQALVAHWFAGNLLWLWFGAIAVAALYYLIPKILGKRLIAYSLAEPAFYVLVFAGTFTGVARLVGGPVPAWFITAGIVASIIMLSFYAITGFSFVGTILQNLSTVLSNGVLLFAGFASVALLIGGIGGTILSLRSVAEVTQFTILQDAHGFLLVYGGFGMAMFALVYYMVPRLLGREWPMDFLVNTHFWISFIGILLLVLPLALGGMKQGILMNNAAIPFDEVVRSTSLRLLSRSMAWIFLLVGHLCLILNMVLILKPDCESCVEELTRTDADTVGGVES